jgi:hypothetical protein
MGNEVFVINPAICRQDSRAAGCCESSFGRTYSKLNAHGEQIPLHVI